VPQPSRLDEVLDFLVLAQPLGAGAGHVQDLARSAGSAKDLHGTGNVFTTARVAHPTGLAVSSDEFTSNGREM